uniref:Cytochrome c oxidase subunit 2 n=1 Tax=Pselaphanus sp. QL-2013 TaxID=1421598 RepID=A0A0A6ZL83_9HYME|nr:cytochrome c oxidase subunit II [Pselaphanus sp. QL-2013]
MYTWLMLNFQDSNSWIMTLMTYFHDLIMIFMFIILLIIFYIMFIMILNKYISQFMLFNHLLEIIWTLLPMMVLFLISIPSLKILYLIDEINNPFLTMKIIGNQWYWSYEYSDFNELMYDSFMIKDMNNLDLFRALDVDNRLILPYKTYIRSLITSLDVIHSWTIPSLGVKVDATPGRLNQILLMISRPGLFFGQCSEICGLNHSFMPIVLESVNMKVFMNWITSLNN